MAPHSAWRTVRISSTLGYPETLFGSQCTCKRSSVTAPAVLPSATIVAIPVLPGRKAGVISRSRPLSSARCRLFPPLWGAENSQQPVKRLCIAPRARTSWYVTCLEPPWALLPLEPRVRPLVGHFGLASIGTERTPHRSAYIIGWANSCSTRLQQKLDHTDY